MRTPAALALGLAFALALAGCGGTLDTDKLEEQAKAAIARDIGVTVAAVDCPGDVEAKAGTTFTCTATGADGSTAAVSVEQTDDEGNVKISAELVDMPSVEAELAKQIGGTASVSCPDSLIVARKGQSFTCDAEGEDGTAGKVRVTFENDEGRFTAEVVADGGGS